MATPQGSNEERIACSILERHHSSLSHSMTSPYTVVRICQILYSKRCVDEPTLDDVESEGISLRDKKKLMLATVRLSVSDDHRKLHELATVLEKFKKTKSIANNIISDYNDEHLKVVKRAASEAVRKNIIDLKNAISVSFENIILACEQEKLIPSDFKTNLLDPSTNNKATRCSNLITHIHNLVGVQPAHLDTFLCILHGKDLLASEVANSVAKSYGYNLPKYERIRGVGGATSVVSSDDNVEEMVPQMSNEDRASDILRTHYSTLSKLLKDPVNLARLLHRENAISEVSFTQVELANTCNQTTVLLGLVRRAVHDNHQHLYLFGRVLQQLTVGNENVGKAIMEDYNKATFRFLPENISQAQHQLKREMEEDFTEIKAKFGIMCIAIKNILTKHNVPVDDMKSYCKFMYSTYSQQIENSQTMEDVLSFLANKCTLINVRLLKVLVDYCKIEEAKDQIETYQSAIEEFRAKMRVRFPLNQPLLPEGSPPPLRGETITFIMKWTPESVSLGDIENLLKFAFESLYDDVKLIVMKEGRSVIITCSFAYKLTMLLIAKGTKNLKVLKKNGLKRLTIGYCTIYDEEEKEETTDVQSTNEKVTSERERELEQPLNIRGYEVRVDIDDQKNNLTQTTIPPFLSDIDTSSDDNKMKRVEWFTSDWVSLRSPTPSDGITLIHQLSIDKRPCDMISLWSSSTDSTIILLSQLHQTNVKRLEIIDTQLNIKDINCLCHFININQLKYLSINNSSLSTSGGLHFLTDAISANRSLGELVLYNDRLTEDDMVNISQILTINTTLQRLKLWNCKITNDGLVQLSNGLTHNKTLKKLDINGDNLITSTTTVCDIIHNSSLTHLYLYNTSLPSDSIPQLLNTLSTNNTIQLEINGQVINSKRQVRGSYTTQPYQFRTPRLSPSSSIMERMARVPEIPGHRTTLQSLNVSSSIINTTKNPMMAMYKRQTETSRVVTPTTTAVRDIKHLSLPSLSRDQHIDRFDISRTGTYSPTTSSHKRAALLEPYDITSVEYDNEPMTTQSLNVSPTINTTDNLIETTRDERQTRRFFQLM